MQARTHRHPEMETPKKIGHEHTKGHNNMVLVNFKLLYEKHSYWGAHLGGA